MIVTINTLNLLDFRYLSLLPRGYILNNLLQSYKNLNIPLEKIDFQNEKIEIVNENKEVVQQEESVEENFTDKIV